LLTSMMYFVIVIFSMNFVLKFDISITEQDQHNMWPVL
jgi:hypothetical protein